MIANLNPSVYTFEDTYNTLHYANRAKKIKVNVERNSLDVNQHITNYHQIIQQLKQENTRLKLEL